jgi:hypothetical protein
VKLDNFKELDSKKTLAHVRIVFKCNNDYMHEIDLKSRKQLSRYNI